MVFRATKIFPSARRTSSLDWVIASSASVTSWSSISKETIQFNSTVLETEGWGDGCAKGREVNWNDDGENDDCSNNDCGNADLGTDNWGTNDWGRMTGDGQLGTDDWGTDAWGTDDWGTDDWGVPLI
ncbi:hypothetical protein BS47DRAFT_1369765 [Hydnum rufescens UP504]|uniref:Uncharacterized protein n=1 Tax=Hydnum rufescens UP504 TaxID=1448309 RepID=A0A9P6DLE2_9AGAM|nr:hypothetical protein BS47DRAFT_1369765 [Hydnum rufescens UP504]